MLSNGIIFHGHLDYFQKAPRRGRLNTKLEDCGTSLNLTTIHLLYFIMCEDSTCIEIY